MSTQNKRLTIVKESAAYWRIVFDNPPFNYWDPWLFAELNQLMDRVEEDEKLKVIVFESSNDDFFVNHHDVANRRLVPNMEGAKPFFHEWPRFVERLINSRVLSISKVRGRAWAQGFEFALATDLIFASREKAKFSLVEVGAGSIPGGGGIEWLTRQVGRARALEIVLGSEEYDGELGERYGFVNRAIPDEELDHFVNRFAKRIASFPKRSLLFGKQLVNAHSNLPTQSELFTSNYILHAFDDWEGGKLEYPSDGRVLDFSDPGDLELHFPQRLGE